MLNTEWFFLDERIFIFFVTALSFDNFDALKQILFNQPSYLLKSKSVMTVFHKCIYLYLFIDVKPSQT